MARTQDQTHGEQPPHNGSRVTACLLPGSTVVVFHGWCAGPAILLLATTANKHVGCDLRDGDINLAPSPER